MGIDVSYDFHVPRAKVAGFLAALTDLSDPEVTRRTTVVLPDGTLTTLPGPFGFIDGRAVELDVVAADRTGRDFALVLGFPADEPLLAYRDEEGGDRVMMGYIYLGVDAGHTVLPDHYRFWLMPATTEQSRLFLMSPSIRETFATLALETGTSLCLLDPGWGGEEIVVTALGQRVSTRVPGPCMLWRARGRDLEAFQELSARLAGNPRTPPERILDRDHPDFQPVIDSLADYAGVASHLWISR